MKKKVKSIRMKLFFTLCVTLIIIILLLILINSFVLEKFYLYSKQKKLLQAYDVVNNYYNGNRSNINLELELEKIALNNDFDILIKSDRNEILYITNKDFSNGFVLRGMTNINKNDSNTIFQNEKLQMIKVSDEQNGLNFIILEGKLDNGYSLFIRVAITSIQESVKISNNFLCLLGRNNNYN